MFVATPTPRPNGGAMFMAAPQDITEVLDLMEFRISIEVEAAGLAAERRTEIHLLRMEQALAQFRRNLNDKSLATDADRAFHRAIAEATSNSRFRLFVDEMGDRLIPRAGRWAPALPTRGEVRVPRGSWPSTGGSSLAISERKSDEARAAMRRHLEDGRRRYREWRILHDANR